MFAISSIVSSSIQRAEARLAENLGGPRGLLDSIALNPQPLPPRDDGAGKSPLASLFHLDDWCGTVPKRFPFPPPPPPWLDLFSQPAALPQLERLGAGAAKVF